MYIYSHKQYKREAGHMKMNTTASECSYARLPVQVVSGKGSWLTDADGKNYIDMSAGGGVTAFGVADDAWNAAVTEQLQTLQHTSCLYHNDPCSELADCLCNVTGMHKAVFANSGDEANEFAVDIARRYAQKKYGDGRSTVVTLRGGFLGRFCTADFCTIGTDNVYELNAVAARTNIAAILIECVQGDGATPLSQEFVQQVADFAKAKDILLIADEVQCGNGRTGSLYAYMQYGIVPDIVTTANGLGGGLPIGVTLLSEKVQAVLEIDRYGSVFGGNPVCCAGALNILSRLDETLLADVRRKGEWVLQTLRQTDGVVCADGLGLMISFTPKKAVDEVVKALAKQGVLCLPYGNKIGLLPALNIPDDLLKQALQIIQQVL